jgi:hypothetical protein
MGAQRLLVLAAACCSSWQCGHASSAAADRSTPSSPSPRPAAHPPRPRQQVRWWTNWESDVRDGRTPGRSVQMLALIAAHPHAVSGIYTYLGAGVADSGAFSFGFDVGGLNTKNSVTWVRETAQAYTRLGLSVTPALGLTSHSLMSGNALAHVAEVAAFAKAANVSGLMLDFEPRAPYTPSESAYVHAYAEYVTAFTKAMHAVGLKAEMCVSDWVSALAAFPAATL